MDENLTQNRALLECYDPKHSVGRMRQQDGFRKVGIRTPVKAIIGNDVFSSLLFTADCVLIYSF